MQLKEYSVSTKKRSPCIIEDEDKMANMNHNIKNIVFGYCRREQQSLIKASSQIYGGCDTNSSETESGDATETEEVETEMKSESITEPDSQPSSGTDSPASDAKNKENNNNNNTDTNIVIEEHEESQQSNAKLAVHTPNAESTSLSLSRQSSTTTTTEIDDSISALIVLYYYDNLLLNTNIAYSSWSDLESLCTSKQDIVQLQAFYQQLCKMGYNPQKLPKYEMLRYYFGTSKDMQRALNKWKGSIDTYAYYQLSDIDSVQIKKCIVTLTKSCHFVGYHGEETDKPSPVFVFDYQTWNWADFGEMALIIKASFFICNWMTDNVEAIDNGITLMVNSKGVRFMDIKKLLTLLKAIQKSLPLRTNHCFFLNLPSLAKSAMNMFLKIYPKHIQDRMHIHSDIDSLGHVLSHDEIPKLFGGGLDRPVDEEHPPLASILSDYSDVKEFKHLETNDPDYWDNDARNVSACDEDVQKEEENGSGYFW